MRHGKQLTHLIINERFLSFINFLLFIVELISKQRNMRPPQQQRKSSSILKAITVSAKDQK